MHRTTILLPDELYYKLRDLGWKTSTSVSLLLEAAALHSLAPILAEQPAQEAFIEWESRVRALRWQRDRRLRGNRNRYGDET
jgi:hypothetical protein